MLNLVTWLHAMDQYESPEPKFYAYAQTRARKRPIVCCQLDWDMGEI